MAQLRASNNQYESSFFDNTTVKFLDGSRWLIERPISHLVLERSYSPSEAKPTFRAVCVKDMSGTHRKSAEAVIKVIYQVYASEETIDSYQDEIDTYKKDNARSAEAQAELDDVQESLDQCTKPAPLPSKYTVDDMSALMEFYQHRTSCTPWLLDFVRMPLPAGVHHRGLVGGYLAIMLVTKIPETHLSSIFLESLTLAERDQVRKDFKKAFLYIMSFEEISVPSAEERESQEIDDNVYKYWGLNKDV